MDLNVSIDYLIDVSPKVVFLPASVGCGTLKPMNIVTFNNYSASGNLPNTVFRRWTDKVAWITKQH